MSEKVVKTIIYATKNYYRQDVVVDKNLTNNEVLDLWKNDKIDVVCEVEPYDNIFNGEIEEAFIAE